MIDTLTNFPTKLLTKLLIKIGIFYDKDKLADIKAVYLFHLVIAYIYIIGV